MAFPGTYNFNYYSGDTFEFQVYPTDSDGGVFDNLNSYTPKFIIGTSRGSSSAVVLSSDNPNTIKATLSQTNEYVTCELTAASGATLNLDTYVYDVEIHHNSNGKVYTLLTGTITVSQDVG